MYFEKGKESSEMQDWAEYTWQQLSAVGNKIIKEGHTLDSPEENLAELRSLAIQFKERSCARSKRSFKGKA